MLTRQNMCTNVIGVGALFITGTFLWLLCSCLLTFSSVRASGRVVQLVQRHDNDVVYCPVYIFRDAAGFDHIIHSSAGSNPPRFPVGSTVSVLYRAQDPSNAHIEDRFILWIAPLIIMAISVFCGAVAYVIEHHKNHVTKNRHEMLAMRGIGGREVGS